MKAFLSDPVQVGAVVCGALMLALVIQLRRDPVRSFLDRVEKTAKAPPSFLDHGGRDPRPYSAELAEGIAPLTPDQRERVAEVLAKKATCQSDFANLVRLGVLGRLGPSAKRAIEAERKGDLRDCRFEGFFDEEEQRRDKVPDHIRDFEDPGLRTLMKRAEAFSALDAVCATDDRALASFARYAEKPLPCPEGELKYIYGEAQCRSLNERIAASLKECQETRASAAKRRRR